MKPNSPKSKGGHVGPAVNRELSRWEGLEVSVGHRMAEEHRCAAASEVANAVVQCPSLAETGKYECHQRSQVLMQPSDGSHEGRKLLR